MKTVVWLFWNYFQFSGKGISDKFISTISLTKGITWVEVLAFSHRLTFPEKKRRDLKAPVLTLAVGIAMAFIDTFPNSFIFGTRGVGAEKVKALAP